MTDNYREKINKTLNFARKHGLNVIPIKYGDKVPIGKWKDKQEAKITGGEIKKYFLGSQKHNIGFVCGAISDNLVVIDFDDVELYKKFFPKYEELERITTVVKTGRGIHVYFKTDKPIKTFNIKDDRGREVITVKGEGGYVIAPPSLHPSGKHYEFISCKEIAREKGDIRQQIIERAEKLGLRPIRESIDIKEILKGVPEGARDNSLTYLIHWLRRAGEDKEKALKLCKEWNERNRPPLEDKTIEYKVNYHYNLKEPYNYFYRQDPAKYKITDKLKLRKVKGEKKPKSETFKFVPKEWAEEILEEERVVCLDDSEELLVYKDGVYVPGEAYLKEKAQELLGEHATTHRVNEIVNFIRRATYVSRDKLNRNKELINLKNGVLNIFTKEFKPHSPDYLFTFMVPVEYNPNADCPKIKEFLSQILHEDDIPTVLEFIGYCLYRDYPYQKALMCVGDGANGKSTLLALIKKFLGERNVASVSLQDLGENRFASSKLFGKLANIFADLPDRKFLNTGVFKMLCGGDLIYAERKFQNPFSFVNFAKLIFSANRLPMVYDDSDAFFRRWIIINFPNRFEGEKADKKLLEKLATPEELSGLLNLALEGLERLINNGGFSNEGSIDELREEYIRKSDSAAAFIMDCIEIDSEGIILKDDLYEAYVKYCDANKLPKVAKNVLTRDYLYKKIPSLSETKIYVEIGGERVRKRAWKGIRLNNEALQKCLLKCPGCFEDPGHNLDTKTKISKNVQDVQDVSPFLLSHSIKIFDTGTKGKIESLDSWNSLVNEKKVLRNLDTVDTETNQDQTETKARLLDENLWKVREIFRDLHLGRGRVRKYDFLQALSRLEISKERTINILGRYFQEIGDFYQVKPKYKELFLREGEQ